MKREQITSQEKHPLEDPNTTLYQDVLEAIKDDNPKLAHRLLIAKSQANKTSARYWTLMGWSALNPHSAIGYFRKALKINAEDALAAEGLQWAVEWLTKKRNTKKKSSLTGTSINVFTPNISNNITNIAHSDDSSLVKRKILSKSQFIIPIIYLLAIALAETLTSFSFPGVGMVLHGIILVALMLHGALFSKSNQQKLLLTLTLAPLIRVMSLSLPLPNFPLVYWYALVGAPLLLAAFLVGRVINFNWKVSLLRVRKLPIQIFIGMTGLGLGFIEYLILKPEPLATALSWEYLWMPALILVIFTGLLEEVIFRGLIQNMAIDNMGRFGLIYGAMLFAVLHFGYHSALDVIFVFGVALYFSLVVSKTGSLLGVTLAHGLTNVALFLIFPFLV